MAVKINPHLERALCVISSLENTSLNKNGIIREVSKRTGIGIEEILGGSRTYQVKFYRQAIHYLLRRRGYSLTEIARATRMKDHVTVINSVKRIEGYIEAYKPLMQQDYII